MKRRLWTVPPVLLVADGLFGIAVGCLWFWNVTAFLAGLVLFFLLVGATVLYAVRLSRNARRYLSRIAEKLDPARRQSLKECPFPVAVGSAGDEIVWYNDRFRDEVADGVELLGEPLDDLLDGHTVASLGSVSCLDVTYGQRQYTVFVQAVGREPERLFVLYYVEDTQLKETEAEYRLSRPAVLMIYIDNLEELMQRQRESDRAKAASKVEAVLEDWQTSLRAGVFRRYEQGRFLLVTEHRCLQTMVARKFDVLDTVRRISVEGMTGITLSIGVGEGAHVEEAEAGARQALEMALGRGGDQAAVKHENGFDFYGGVSKGVEKRTKVRSRVVASALLKLMDQSDRVLCMGHRFSDLDCLGAAVALTAVARTRGKEAYTVVDRGSSLAGELLERYDKAGDDWFLSPLQALEWQTERTLLIVTDTHAPGMLESRELYEKAETVVVIDHHRKMVDHIENAVIFYHETYASSASEMVTELIQAMDGVTVSPLEAEALLAGITLDTRHFVMKVGARTFEAAAALRSAGADPVAVKRLFSGSFEAYRRKTEIMAAAEAYHGTAIACHEGGGKEVRIAAAQAADELLSVRGVSAAFTLFTQDGGVNVSARSLGDFNVQVVMEALGGGGHLTMAGAFLADTDLETARRRLMAAVDARLNEETAAREETDT